MLIIGHRGAAGSAPENTIKSLQAGLEAQADMLEFDVRLTKDNIPVLIHNFHTLRTHKKPIIVRHQTYDELVDKLGKDNPVVPLETVLKRFFGKVLLNIELKGGGTGALVTKYLEETYIKKKSDWDLVLLSSFKPAELVDAREVNRYVNLAMLHSVNPFLFVRYQRKLHLTAVGFHRLHVNRLAVEIANRIGIFTYAYTVNRVKAMRSLAEKGIDGVVTNYPDKFREALSKN